MGAPNRPSWGAWEEAEQELGLDGAFPNQPRAAGLGQPPSDMPRLAVRAARGPRPQGRRDRREGSLGEVRARVPPETLPGPQLATLPAPSPRPCSLVAWHPGSGDSSPCQLSKGRELPKGRVGDRPVGILVVVKLSPY